MIGKSKDTVGMDLVCSAAAKTIANTICVILDKTFTSCRHGLLSALSNHADLHSRQHRLAYLKYSVMHGHIVQAHLYHSFVTEHKRPASHTVIPR